MFLKSLPFLLTTSPVFDNSLSLGEMELLMGLLCELVVIVILPLICEYRPNFSFSLLLSTYWLPLGCLSNWKQGLAVYGCTQ